MCVEFSHEGCGKLEGVIWPQSLDFCNEFPWRASFEADLVLYLDKVIVASSDVLFLMNSLNISEAEATQICNLAEIYQIQYCENQCQQSCEHFNFPYLITMLSHHPKNLNFETAELVRKIIQDTMLTIPMDDLKYIFVTEFINDFLINTYGEILNE